MFERMGRPFKRSDEAKNQEESEAFGSSRRNFLRGAAALGVTAITMTPGEVLAKNVENHEVNEKAQAEKIASALESQPFLVEIAALKNRKATSREYYKLVKKTLLEAAQAEGIEVKYLREVLIILFRHNYYVDLDAYESDGSWIYELESLHKEDFSNIPAVQMFSSDVVHGTFYYGVIKSDQLAKIGSSQGHSRHGTILNRTRLEEQISAFNNKVLPKSWSYTMDATKYAKSIIANEASHIVFPHFFPHLYSARNEEVRNEFFAESMMGTAHPTAGQIDEFLSDSASVQTDPYDLVRIINRMVRLLDFNDIKGAVGINSNDNYGYTYAVVHRLLLPMLWRNGFDSMQDLYLTPKEDFANLDDPQSNFAEPRILSVIGQEGLTEIAEQMGKHAEKTIEILRQEEQKLAVKK